MTVLVIDHNELLEVIDELVVPVIDICLNKGFQIFFLEIRERFYRVFLKEFEVEFHGVQRAVHFELLLSMKRK